MAHLAAGAGRALAIEMDARVTLACEHLPLIHIIADEICHHCIGMACGAAERPAANRADMLFELADDAGIHRPVAGIMDTGRDLVHEKALSARAFRDRKSTRLNSSHVKISYAVFCLKKKKRHK